MHPINGGRWFFLLSFFEGFGCFRLWSGGGEHLDPPLGLPAHPCPHPSAEASSSFWAPWCAATRTQIVSPRSTILPLRSNQTIGPSRPDFIAANHTVPRELTSVSRTRMVAPRSAFSPCTHPPPPPPICALTSFQPSPPDPFLPPASCQLRNVVRGDGGCGGYCPTEVAPAPEVCRGFCPLKGYDDNFPWGGVASPCRTIFFCDSLFFVVYPDHEPDDPISSQPQRSNLSGGWLGAGVVLLAPLRRRGGGGRHRGR